jgi:TonB family protein
VNLAPADDEAQLSPALRSRLERAQETRRRSGEGRSSPEDDTVTERPMILTFFADGSGSRREPRPASRHDPAGGAWDRFRAQAPGPPEREPPRGNAWLGRGWYEGGSGEPRAPGAGVLDRARGRDSRPSAAVAEGRPMALRGRDSTRSSERGPESDRLDAEQEVMTLHPSFFNASTAGGVAPGQGRGGEPGADPTGSGGLEGPGSRAQALGDGRGRGIGIDPGDARRRSYLRRMWQRIQGSWSPAAFPKWAALQGLAGTTIVSFVVGPDGSVSQVVTARPSGYPDFDAAMRAAVLGAAPFGPLPPELRPILRHSHEFAVTNPAVR